MIRPRSPHAPKLSAERWTALEAATREALAGSPAMQAVLERASPAVVAVAMEGTLAALWLCKELEALGASQEALGRIANAQGRASRRDADPWIVACELLSDFKRGVLPDMSGATS